ncbi:helix-turn-helix transcriptional regulator [Actinomadura oligospora]|uniref:helix-turn-helix transcriptional regulator n=1 Tax=Actinomadura oligospora TaxID=111804 RepID=UPI000685AECF|nr:LuxR family transcriptional regulator [Actinomadura oligospora]
MSRSPFGLLETPVLLGRQAELDRVLRVVEDGEPPALLVTGEVGVGKSELLGQAARHARDQGMTVLEGQGDGVPYGCLNQALHPLLDDLDQRQRAELGPVLDLGADAAPVPPTAVGTAVLRLLASRFAARPGLLVIDDLHLVDRHSLHVLSFVVRRGAHAGVRTLAAGGPGSADRLGPQAPVMTVAGLGDADAARLLDAQPRPPAGRDRTWILRRADGNPLALIDLAAGVPAGRTGGLDLDARLRALPDGPARLLLLAAADPDAADLPTIMAAAGTAPHLADWRAAEDAGLVTLIDQRVVFTHPLVGAVCYRRAPAEARRRAHRDLAAVIDEPARRARHLAAAVVGYDEDVARMLEATAAESADMVAAARALDSAADLSPAARDRARRRVKTLVAAAMAGERAWVHELCAQVTRGTTDPEPLGVAAACEAMASSLTGRQQEARRVALAALNRLPDPAGTAGLALRVVAAMAGYHVGVRPEPAEPPRPDGTVRLKATDATDATGFAAVTDGLDRTDGGGGIGQAVEELVAVIADPASAAGVVQRRGPERHVRDEPMWLAARGVVAWFADEPEQCVDHLERLRCAAPGHHGPLAPCLAPLASALIDTGRWDRADEVLAEAGRLAAVHGLTRLDGEVTALGVTLDALRGRPAPSPEWPSFCPEDNRATHALLLHAAGTRAAAAGDHEEAYRRFRALWDADGREPLHHVLSMRSIVELASAARHTGRAEEVAGPLAAAREAAGPRPTTRMTLLLHHAAALLDDSAAAERHYRLAVVNPAGEQWPLSRARARLDYAQWLRRRRRPSEARPLLAAARDTFAMLGAEPWTLIALAELRAAGVVPASSEAVPASAGEPAGLDALTAQEQRIVRLAAQGLGNREIGERLRLSPRTVGSHLYRVFPKLGVSRRHQLRDVLDGA